MEDTPRSLGDDEIESVGATAPPAALTADPDTKDSDGDTQDSGDSDTDATDAGDSDTDAADAGDTDTTDA